MLSSRARRFSAAVILAVPWGLTGCSSGDSPGEPGTESGADAGFEALPGSDAGMDAHGPETSTEAGLDSTPSCVPEPGPDLPDDDFRDSNCDGVDGDASAAIFVAPAGSDTNAGSITHPVSSLHKAVELAEAAGKSIYLCSATWSEPLVVGAPLSIHGGYDCANGWQRSNTVAEVVSSDGPALQISNVAERVLIERVTFKVGDALVAGGSSVAASVVSSQQVELRRCGFEAGDGANGVAGLPPEATAGTGPNGQDGGSLGVMTCAKGNPVGDCAKWGVGGNDPMTFCFSKGGRGGDGGNLVKSHAQQPGSAGTPDGASGGTLDNIGLPGQVGAAGGMGAAASSGMGTIAEGKYVSSNVGTDGETGAVGKGGGGGSGGKTGCVPNSDCSVETKFYAGGGGGQGGGGGAGGKGGKGGGGGGASIGILAVDSQVTVDRCSLKTGLGGTGGSPSAGASGQPGGKGGKGGAGTYAKGNGYDGGNGGAGGPGGSGGPGGGGPSIGVLLQGGALNASQCVFDLGLGGDGGKGLAGPDGADGQSDETLELTSN